MHALMYLRMYVCMHGRKLSLYARLNVYIYIYIYIHTSLNPQPRNSEPVSSLRPGLVAAQQRDTSGLHDGVSALIREWGLGNL